MLAQQPVRQRLVLCWSDRGHPESRPKSPFVLIAGGGTGDLTTALICERAGIEYLVLERSTEVKPL
ncbi:hypothetical protein BG000_004244, partial [Podila horticola]